MKWDEFERELKEKHLNDPRVLGYIDRGLRLLRDASEELAKVGHPIEINEVKPLAIEVPTAEETSSDEGEEAPPSPPAKSAITKAGAAPKKEEEKK